MDRRTKIFGSAPMEQERVLARMEQLGAQTVRDMISSGQWPADYHALAQEWLRTKDTGTDLGEAGSPQQAGAPEISSVTAVLDSVTRNRPRKHPFLDVSLLAMAFVGLAALWVAAMLHAGRQAKSPTIAKSAPAIPAAAEQDERLPPPVKHPGYTEITLRDFVLDKGTLVGRKVRVTGLYQQMEGITLLAASGDDMNPIDLDIARLPREERSALLGCPNRDCVFQVEGRVRKSPSGVIVRADDVQKVREN